MQCPVCGTNEEEGDEVQEYQAGGMVTRSAVKLEFKGCCSQDCARVRHLAHEVGRVAMWLQGIGLHLTGDNVSFDSPAE
jgi:hypothetical protein